MSKGKDRSHHIKWQGISHFIGQGGYTAVAFFPVSINIPITTDPWIDRSIIGIIGLVIGLFISKKTA